jgi:SAM-dependent methyltransferase
MSQQPEMSQFGKPTGAQGEQVGWLSVSALPYQDTAFDKVFSVNAFQFWPEPQTDLAEIRRTMKPNGLIAITI